MKTQTINKNKAPHYVWGEGCNSWVLLNTAGLSVKQERMPPHTSERPHFHTKAQQFFFVLKGQAIFYLNDETQCVKEQEGIWVQPNTVHYIKNESPEELHFLVISQPTTDGDRILVKEIDENNKEQENNNIHF